MRRWTQFPKLYTIPRWLFSSAWGAGWWGERRSVSTRDFLNFEKVIINLSLSLSLSLSVLKWVVWSRVFGFFFAKLRRWGDGHNSRNCIRFVIDCSHLCVRSRDMRGTRTCLRFFVLLLYGWVCWSLSEVFSDAKYIGQLGGGGEECFKIMIRVRRIVS